MDTNKEIREFGLYAKSKGISSSKLRGFSNSMQTPYIIEERDMRFSQMDVFSRLMVDRILWISGAIEEDMASIIQAQLMFLDSVNHNDITMHVSSPGGSVSAGLAIVDVMQYIKSDIQTINTSLAASMGSVILGAGSKGKRASLKHSRTMLHQSSGGASGNIQDARLQFEEWEKFNKELFALLGDFCGKPPEVVLEDASRDKWLNAQQAKDYGIVDEILITRKK